MSQKSPDFGEHSPALSYWYEKYTEPIRPAAGSDPYRAFQCLFVLLALRRFGVNRDPYEPGIPEAIISSDPTQTGLEELIGRIRALRARDSALAINLSGKSALADDILGRYFEETAGAVADEMSNMLTAPGRPLEELEKQETLLKAAVEASDRTQNRNLAIVALIWAAFWLLGGVTAYFYMTQIQRQDLTTDVVLGSVGWGLLLGLLYYLVALILWAALMFLVSAFRELVLKRS